MAVKEAKEPVPGVVIEMQNLIKDQPSLDVIGQALDRIGQNDLADQLTGRKREKTLMNRAKAVWNYSPTVGDAVIFACWVAGAVVLYELTAYGFRKLDFNMPSLVFRGGRTEVNKVTQIRKVA